MKLVDFQAEHEEKVGWFAVERVEVDAVLRTPEYHERPHHLLRIAAHRVQERDAVARCAGHDVFAFDERADEPRLIAHKAQILRQRGQLFDSTVLARRLYLG